MSSKRMNKILQTKIKADKFGANFKNLRIIDMKCKSTKKNNENEKFFKKIMPVNELSFAFYSSAFPQVLFTEEYVEQLNKLMEIMKLQIPNGEMMPRIIYMIFEGGYCKVKVADIFSKDWIVGNVTALMYQGMPLIVSSVKRIPKCFFATKIPGEVLDDTTILTTINRDNNNISTSRWSILIKRQEESDFVAVFVVDAINAHVIESLNHVLSFGAGQIQFEFQ